ncbi:DNA repair protein RecO [Longibacter salinarum]|uniref:DNA repair protein RecO n=1 Tax=Longibacter salinarum TaxID=1850348 RepID=A0A2A8CU37_9BACT|nr:DNA repair protein RecO [Longibacter salinarum]PEN11309.1 DNA repair protein RecO [Longibacter salinarum]
MAKRDIIRSQAIVLRGMDYSETSRIVTLFTRKQGKISVMAKGARRTKSSFGSTLQPMAYTQVVYYYKPTRTLQMLTESSHVTAFHDLNRRLEKITIGLRIVELVDALMEEEDRQPSVFALVLQALDALNRAEERIDNLWPFVQLRIARALGVAPSIDRENVEAVTDAGGILSLANGGVYPRTARPSHARTASRAALRAFAILARADIDVILRMDLDEQTRARVHRLVAEYMEFHFESAYPTRSRDVIAQLKSGG